MAKRAIQWTAAVAGLFLLTLVCYGCCQSDDDDWFRGCYKQNTSKSCFNVTAGDYNPLINLTGEACVSACSSLNISNKFAGVTANGVCLCSQSDDICLEQVSNTSCDYPQSDGLYYKVYRVTGLPTLDVPSSVMVFDEFNVTIGSAEPNCSYILDYDDGVKITLSSSSTRIVTTHYYASVGEYKITLSAHRKCIPENVMAIVRSANKMFSNVSLDCPNKTIEVTAEESCKLSVLKGSGLNVTELDSGNFVTTLPDTVVETIGFPALEDYNTFQALENGTYVMPFLSAVSDGFLTGIQFGIVSNKTVKIQIWSPKCPDGKKPCRGGCVPLFDNCTHQKLSQKQMLSESCCTSDTNVSTASDNNTNYTVREEFTVNTTKSSKLYLQQLPKPISVKRGDVIAFHLASTASVATANHNGSYILFYCGQEFGLDHDVMASNASKHNNILIWFRLYVTAPVILDIPIKPTLPRVYLAFNVSSLPALDHEVVRETVEVQQRISGLEIWSPLTEVYYPTLKNILFSFNVSNGTNVTYTVDPGDGNVLPNTTLNQLNHNYTARGNHTFTVTASNDINSVNASQNVTLVVDIRNLAFIEDPKLKPGEVGKTYWVVASLEAGDSPTFYVVFGNNISMFSSCDDMGNKTIEANTTYAEVGTYNITVTAFGLVDDSMLSVNSTVEIMEPIKNLTIYQVKSDTITLIKDYSIEKHYAHLPIILLANVSSGSPITYTFTVPGHDSGKIEYGKDNITINSPSGGQWKIDILAKNGISNESYTITVGVVGGCESTVQIYDRRERGKPFHTNLGNDIRFNTDEVFYNESCPKSKYDCWKYNWTLYNVVKTGEMLSTVEFEKHKKFFFIEKGVIKVPGLYKVKMTAVCNETNRKNNRSDDETYFKVEASDPVAIILGGYRRDVTKDDVIILDASTSYDPDVKLFNSSGLRFNWTCVVNCTEVELQKENTSKVEINGTLLEVGEIFQIMVNVSLMSFGKAVNVTQIIEVVGQNVPTTKIVCRVNCLPFVILTDRLSLEGQCLSCKSGDKVTFAWTLDENERKVQQSEIHTTTDFDKENLVLSANTLKRSTKYSVRLKATRNGLFSYSFYRFETPGQLTGGKCEIVPESGTSALTEFYVKCFNWKGGRFPLTYNIRYESSVNVDTSVTSIRDKRKTYERILWYHGQENVSPKTNLPAGRNDTNYVIPIIVEIQGKYGEYAKVNLSVQVKIQKVDGDDILEKIEDLKLVDGADEPQKLAQQIITYAQVLNEGQISTTAEVTNEKLRLTLVEQLSKVKATTLPLIQQTSNALKLAASNDAQVTHETQESGVTKLKEMSEILLNIASNPDTRTGQEIDRTARTMLSSLSKILSASLFTGQDTSKKDAPEEVKPNLYGTLSKKGSDLQKIGEGTQQVVKDWDETIKRITTAMAKKKLFGETPTVATTPDFQIKISKSWKRKKGHDIRQNAEPRNGSDSKAWISLPRSELKFLGNESENIFTEAIAFEKNPYTWDVKRSHYIQPAVFSFNFRKENGEKIRLNDLKEFIEIRLPNRKDNIVHNPLNNSADSEDFLLYSFEVDDDDYEEVIMIDIRHPKSAHEQATFYLKFGEEVSQTNYDFEHPLSHKCVNCSDYPLDIQHNGQSSIVFIREAKKKLESAKGIVSIGLLPCPDANNNSKPTCDPKNHTYDVFVQTVSCRYWNHSKWIKDGCMVGHNSTPFETSCLCNHLTVFGSYIVRPNPLNKFSAEDFRRGYVCFIVVVVIFTFYLIFLVWARRADRSDSSKVGVCALSDNGPQDRYRYEIAIWTGMRRNAGTRSEVTIILSGDKNDSEPRCLINPQNPSFARGSMEKFLLTSSKDIGSLYCIRVWHDNSRGSWYLSRVMVTDLQRDERFYFICDRWLAVDEDDGQVERLLPVASDEELADFHHLFYSKTKRGLSDTHLWISVLNRPPQSIFTRVQRLSCCLCIVMTTMLANAMFYQTRSEPKADTTNFIGSYSFTWDEIYIGVVSSLIIVPVNVIILHIFRNVRPKSRKVRRQSKASMGNLDSGYRNNSRASFETLAESSDQGPIESIAVDTEINVYSRIRSAELKKKRDEKLSRWARFKRCIMPSSLPHGFVYVGWAILVIITLGSATVVVLYGMQFGNGRSLQWLFSIVVSIVEDIFVLQPLKVLVFALGFALLVKKPDEGEFEMSGDYDDDDEVQQGDISGSQDNGPEKRVPASPRLPVRPSEEQLAVMRKTRMKERKMFFLIQEITVHLIFMIIIALVTYGHKDSRSVYLYRHIDGLSKMTDKINNFSHFWNWSRVVLIPKAFPEKLYNGRYVPSYGFLDDGYNYLISKARMRLLRVKSDNCTVADEFKDTIDECLKDYSIFNQDEVCYRPHWNDVKKGSEKTNWCFQNWKNLDGYPTLGMFNTYSGSGYINELRPGDDNNATVNKLESEEWLDKHSRALFVEMTTYNANINLYTSITLLFEFPEFGGIFYFQNIIPMRLKLYVGGFAFFLFACEMAFALFILGYSYIALKKLYRHKMAYFKNFWNIMDFSVLMSSFAAIGVYVYRMDITTKLMRTVQDRDGEFVNFQYVTYWNEILSYIMALVVSLTTVKLTKLMRFNLRISLFGKTLQDAKPALAGFSIQFGIVFFAYVMVGVLVFGYNVSQFKTIVSAVMALGRVILGKSQFKELFSADPIIGPLFFFTYVMFVCWILVSMVVAILTDSYHDVQDRCFGMSNEYEIVDFLLARIRAWSGFGGKKKNRVPADQRWRKAGIKAKAAATLGRQRSYKPSAENIAFEKTGDLMEKFEDSIRSLEKKVDHLYVHF